MASARRKSRRSTSDGSARVLGAAYDLFVRKGVRQVGVDDIIARAGVAKATFYRNFGSKDDLMVAFLRHRGDRWTEGWLKSETRRRKRTPRGRLLVVFDLLDEWFQSDEFEGCPFVGAVASAPEPRDRVRREAVAQLGAVHDFVHELAAEAELASPMRFASAWQLMMEGAIVMALSGGRDAARLARSLAESFLASYPTARPRKSGSTRH